MSENLRLLFSLYWRPRRTLGRILDEGSLLFGAASVLVVSLLLTLAFFLPLWATLEAQTHRRSIKSHLPFDSLPVTPACAPTTVPASMSAWSAIPA